jgi:hypothetical protein
VINRHQKINKNIDAHGPSTWVAFNHEFLTVSASSSSRHVLNLHNSRGYKSYHGCATCLNADEFSGIHPSTSTFAWSAHRLMVVWWLRWYHSGKSQQIYQLGFHDRRDVVTSGEWAIPCLRAQ